MAPIALYAGFYLVQGNPEGPYYYDAEKFQPEEYEFYENALARFFFKYIVPSDSVAHWQTCASYKYQDEIKSKHRLIQDVRRISNQVGATAMNASSTSMSHNVGGRM